jgi:hypothetical protein
MTEPVQPRCATALSKAEIQLLATNLKSRFEAEGNGFLYTFREREWKEFLPLVEARAISHHIYHVRL